MKPWIITILLLAGSHTVQADNVLFAEGRSDYSIVLADGASRSELTAAKELQAVLREMSGATLPITRRASAGAGAKAIHIGWTPRTSVPRPDWHDESFTYKTVGNNLFIYGGSERGTMYGVFRFLERELGIHWLTPKCTVVPRLEAWKLPRLHHSESPFIGYRYSNYFVASGVPEWSAHTRENMKWSPNTNAYGNIEAYWGAHTMGHFVPTKEFFETHPEYFCLRDGKRYGGYGQLCLSNPDVLELCKTRLMQFMRENPQYRIYSLSQNDNFLFCQCDKCKAIEEQYGGHSGIIVWFVNQVADAVRE